MLIPYTILEECLVLGSNLVCSGAVLDPNLMYLNLGELTSNSFNSI
jgi:hypothetical protein